jgi:hypothetical protein
MRLTLTTEGEYAATGVTTSFFEDPRTKEVLATLANPYTGKTNTVTPNLIGGTGRAAAYYSTQGVRPGRVARDEWAYGGLHLTWDYHEEQVWLSHDRVYPPGMPQPMGESTVMRARIADLHDPGRPFVAAGFSSTYFAPWPKWMEMAGQPGHVIWHADGVKIESAARLPADFRARMEKLYPERLAAPAYDPKAG